ncbi:hypothetical protein Asulf_00419 [Archaeoglobus sulfaticallidus PM70-1]|uniref:O-methyltransferase domain-containing protein n=1 Tax=Archaeoglobus sulfaticallidus PM70-1 TaxID=387631 RepID=N0BJ02_9EURY|nr:methyltransferase [Archaeoglobus sulfaticallidus]AGK60446.1 hypothetical protein Asulf_00419 [Archaeoglobus sulfaticallidus PM70-1]
MEAVYRFNELFMEPPEEFEPFFEDILNGFRKFFLFKSAVDVGIFDMLKEPKTLHEIESKTGFNNKILFLFLENLVKLGLLRKDGDRYVNSEMADKFLTDSPYSQLYYVRNAMESSLIWLNLPKALKGEQTRFNIENFFSQRIIHSLAQNSLLGELQSTVKLISSLNFFRKARKLLDLGGGHGLYSIAFTMLNENLKAYVFDLPDVVEETKKYIRKYNARRVDVIPGNFFTDELGEDYDIVFSSYNPGGKRAELIPKIWRCLKNGGIYINRQCFPESDIDLADLHWNLWNFGIEKGLKAYTFEGDLSLEGYINALEDTGFEILNVFKMKDDVKMIVARKL